jgi:stage III sporulation protein AH
MINKKSLWFLTLFSLILVLSVYYITMPSELLLTTNNIAEEKETETVSTEENESAELVALRVEAEEEMLLEINNLKKVLTNSETTTEDKNEAFNKMKKLNENRGLEEKIETSLSEEFEVKAFVKVKDSDVTVVVDSNKHDKETANKIMRKVQENFDNKVNISVKFQK